MIEQQIEKLRTLQESFNELSSKVLDTQAVLTELNNGKKEMVDALATKNVQSSIDKTLSSIASDIRSIAQSPITIEGGEMYEKQLFGAPTDKTNAYLQPDSPMWNLYQVMANLLSDGRFVTYGGILLGEYPKGDETIVLSGAGAGGAYLTSDGVLYEIDTTHTWNDTLDGKVNRWVAYMFAGKGTNFTINTLDMCPISIHIGREVGTILSNIAGRLIEVVITDGNTLDSLQMGMQQTWQTRTTIRNIKSHDNGVIFYNANNIVDLNCGLEQMGTNIANISSSALPNLRNVIFDKLHTVNIKAATGTGFIFYAGVIFHFDALNEYIDNRKVGSTNSGFINSASALEIRFPLLKLIKFTNYESYSMYFISNCKEGCNIYLDSLETVSWGYYNHNQLITANCKANIFLPNIKSLGKISGTYNGKSHALFKYIHLGARGNKTDSITVLYQHKEKSAVNCYDIEIGDKENIDKGLEPRWYPCQNINLNGCDSLLEENMINHILKRLKQDEEMCGSGVTITLGATNLAKLTSEEAVALLDSLTNTYGYTFA